MARGKGLSKADLQLWAAFTATIAVLPGRARIPVEEVGPGPATPVEDGLLRVAHDDRAKNDGAKQVATPALKPVDVDAAPAGLDRSTWQKFSAGQRRPERKLDLHGMTATRAHHATTGFIQHALMEQVRCIEIVTGKGEILARELPHWLNAPSIRPAILAVAYAPTANTGAVRILLRRAR